MAATNVMNVPGSVADSAPPPHGRDHAATRNAWLLAIVATTTMSVSYLDRQALAVLSPTITKALAMSDSMYGWLTSAFAIAYLVSAPLGGKFIGRVGARRGLVASVAVWSAIAALHAVAPGVAMLFVLRFLLGVAEAPSFPGAAETVSRTLPQSDRNAAYGILFTGSSIGSMIAAPLCSWLAVKWGWRSALVGTALVGSLWIPMWLFATRTPWARSVLDAPKAVPRAMRKAHRSMWQMLREPSVLRALIAIIASAPGIAFAIAWAPKLLVAQHGLGQREVGSYLWLPPLLFDVGAVSIGVLATMRDRAAGPGGLRTHRGLVFLSMLLQASLGLVAFTRTPWATTLVLGISLAGAGGLYGLVTADVMRRVPNTWIAPIAGFTASAQSIAHICANPLIGAVRDRTHSFTGIAIGIGAWVLPGALLWLTWRTPAVRDGERLEVA